MRKELYFQCIITTPTEVVHRTIPNRYSSILMLLLSCGTKIIEAREYRDKFGNIIYSAPCFELYIHPQLVNE